MSPPRDEGSVCARVSRNGVGLERYVAAWRRLASAALEANPFHEPELLLPALHALREGANVDVVLVFQGDPDADPHARMIGLYPLARFARYRGLPLAYLSLWKHRHAFLCTPLVDREQAPASLAGFFDWLRGPQGESVVELACVAGDGAWAAALEACLRLRGMPSAQLETYERALYRPAASAEAYLAAALPGRKRKEFKRLERRLREAGQLETVELAPDEDPAPWIEAFLELEASGWKGRDGTAIAADAAQRRFFVEGARALAAAGRLWMLGIALDGRWIALKCNFLAGRGGFAFKIAYDEKYAQFSPGVLLEIATLKRLQQRPEIEWMDSCAIADHFMANRLWTGRRSIAAWLVATGDLRGRLLVQALPWLQRARRLLRRPAAAEVGAP